MPRSYLLLFADGSGRGLVEYEDDGEEKSAVYLDFKLQEQGETLTLADSAGRVVDRVEIPALAADVSYARLSDGWNVVKNGTPGEDNGGLEPFVLPTLDAPVFSAKSGFYEEPFFLSLAAKEGETVYYTTDGTLPDTDSSRYTEPILIEDASGRENRYAAITGISEWGEYQPAERIDKGTLVRAVCMNEAGEVSGISSQIYFVGYGEKSAYEQIQVLSIEAEPEDFFSEERGIYVLGRDYEKWEEYRKDMGHSFEANYPHQDRTKARRV